MTEKKKLFEELVKKSNKNDEEIKRLVEDKINELSGLVSEEGAIYIIANELGIRLDTEKPKKNGKETKLEKINEPNMQVSFNAKVIKKYDLINFTSQKGNQGSVQSILIGDETGIRRITFWNTDTEKISDIDVGDIIKINNAYTRENSQNSDRIDIHFSQYSEIEKNPEGIKIELKEFENQINATPKKISEIEQEDKNIEISGIITDFDIPRYYNACPECFKKVFQEEDGFSCPTHEKVESIKVPIVNLVIDDGSGTITIVGFRDRAEKITSLSSEEIIGLTEDIDKYREFSKKLVRSNIKVVGNISLSTLNSQKQLLVNEILEIEMLEENKNKKTQNKEEEDLEIEEINIDEDLI